MAWKSEFLNDPDTGGMKNSLVLGFGLAWVSSDNEMAEFMIPVLGFLPPHPPRPWYGPPRPKQPKHLKSDNGHRDGASPHHRS